MVNLLLNTGQNILADPMMYLLLGVIIFFTFMVFSNSKKRRRAYEQIRQMQDELRPGQRIRTVDGVVGRIKEIREESPELKTVLLQTGNDKCCGYVLLDICAVFGVIPEEGHTLEGAPAPKPSMSSEQVSEATGNMDVREYVEKRNDISKKKTASKKK